MKASIAYASTAVLAAILGACAMQTESAAPAAVISPTTEAAKPDASMEAAALALYASLTESQRTEAVLPLGDKARNEVIFPGGKRAGIQIEKLDDQQRALAMKLLVAFTSERGHKLCEQIASQGGPEGLGKYYLVFFGEPKPGSAYAWRIAEHHLTIVQVEVAPGQPLSVGPILLGSNPPDFFEAEEDALIQLYASLSADEKQLVTVEGIGPSAEPIVAAGAQIWKLSAASQAKLTEVFEQRLGFFSATIQARIRAVLAERGGLKAMHLAFYGAADKRCKDGGKWDCKIGGPTFLCDYENSRGHIHLSLKAEVVRPVDAR